MNTHAFSDKTTAAHAGCRLRLPGGEYDQEIQLFEKHELPSKGVLPADVKPS